jgi:putrescine transport system substrate-binding protein
MTPRLPRLPAAFVRLARCCTLAAGLALPVSAAPLPAAGPEPKVLNIYNWSDYIADDTLRNFEKETGIKVNYDTYDSNEILHSKLIAGKTGYDIVVPSAHFAKMQLEAGLFQKLDRGKLTNWGNLDPNLLQLMGRVDPGNQYLVDWLWGFITVGVNTGKVRQALGGLAMPDNPWQLVFDPKYADKLKTCGISVLDSPSELMPIALGYAGKPQYSRATADYAAATAMLRKIRPDVSRFSSSGYINDLASGSLCAVLGYSGDINIARARAIAAKNGNDIVAFVPRAGATLFFDSMAIPADAPHPANALLFINYILRPEVAASLTDKVFYANPNRASLKLLPKAIAANDSIFPKPEEMARMAVPETLPQEAKRIQTRAFTEFKTGQ